MKIRSGFVSNSSSSSFLIFGVNLSNEEAAKLSRVDHEYYSGNDDCCVHCFGISWDDVGDDETGRQFKQRVMEEVNAALRKFGFKERDAIEFETQSHAWYDG
jgi:hypothetical protein